VRFETFEREYDEQFYTDIASPSGQSQIKKLSSPAASELTRSVAKTGFIKHHLAIVKGSWTVPSGLKRSARPAGSIGAAAARPMSTPTPIVLFLVSIGLGLFGLRIFGIEALRYKWVLAISICLVAYGAFLYVIAKRPNSN
jgi:hypothetical protein